MSKQIAPPILPSLQVEINIEGGRNVKAKSNEWINHYGQIIQIKPKLRYLDKT
jgi:hypothetical protein